MKKFDISQYSEKLKVRSVRISDLHDIELHKFVSKNPWDLMYDDIAPGCVLYLRMFEEPYIVIDYNTYRVLGFDYGYSNHLYAAKPNEKSNSVDMYNFTESYCDSFPHYYDYSGSGNYDIVQIYFPEKINISFSSKNDFYDYYENVSNNTNKTIDEKLKIRPVNSSDLSIETNEFIYKEPYKLKYSDIKPGYILYLKKFNKPYIIVDYKIYNMLGFGEGSSDCLFAAGCDDKNDNLIIFNFTNTYNSSFPNDGFGSDGYDIVGVCVPVKQKTKFTTREDFLFYYETVLSDTAKTVNEKLKIRPVNVKNLDDRIDHERIECFLESPKENLRTNDIVRINGNLYWTFVKNDIEKYGEKHYFGFEYKDGVFYYTSVDTDRNVKPVSMAFGSYDHLLNYTAGWASEESFTIHEVYLQTGRSKFVVNKLEDLTQETLEMLVKTEAYEMVLI